MATMEDLTKTQIVLLTLLVSFVTSIATGIMTTSLLAEAPASVTQTINRVVERTIEKVAPETATSTPRENIVREVTVVREEDAVMNSIEVASKSIMRIKQSRSSGADENFYSIGTIVSPDGLVIADRKPFYQRSLWRGTLHNGATTTLELVATDEDANLVLFRIKKPEGSSETYPSIALAKSNVKLGQSIIAIEGIEKNVVSLGRVLGINTGTGDDAATVYSVDTDIVSPGISGSPLLNLSGELVGIRNSNDNFTFTPGAFTTLTSIRRLVEASR